MRFLLRLLAFFLTLGSVLGLLVVLDIPVLSLFHLSEILFILVMGGAAWLAQAEHDAFRNLALLVKEYFWGSYDEHELDRDVSELMHRVVREHRVKGMKGIEDVAEMLRSGRLSDEYPALFADPDLVSVLADGLELLATDPTADISYIQDIIGGVMQTHLDRMEKVPESISRVSEWMPGFGIAAAIVGVIGAMRLLSGDMDISALGEAISLALSGTFLGVFISFGLLSPLAYGLFGVIDRKRAVYTRVLTLFRLLSRREELNPKVAQFYALCSSGVVERGRGDLKRDHRVAG